MGLTRMEGAHLDCKTPTSNMRHLMALLLLTLATSQAVTAIQDDYGSAGSDDIYLQSSGLPDQVDAKEENDTDADTDPDDPDDADDDDDDDGDDDEKDEEQQEKPLNGSDVNNIEAIGETELSCEYSCPRYYRPVCVSRNDELVTYATPCEFFNHLRCSNVAKRKGQATPTFQLLYHKACQNNTQIIHP
ncbi:GH12147 [Drosophila grimshawi]|uniref:GH12147 n=1 Tax=Drosophila grimshawi TaxID=7222 RepID=B4JJZ3_DROGR|nr:GH12147 [Drosophila grimshawi]